tara:strand:- start:1735 stop:2601 length:867 start_codon:yes stop_codon:yes gene_type:complete
MIQSARQRRKKRQDLMGIVGIIALFVIFGGGFYFLQSTNDPLDEFKCSIKNGPNAVTAIIFDKSQMYTNDQVTDIKTSFNLWLAGNEATTKNRRIDLDFFQEGSLVQLYVADENALSQPDGLEPMAELCVPKDFRDANQWIENPAFLKADYDDFISKFSSIIEGLLEKAEGNSPIMETLIRISNSESFQKHPNVNHNIFIVSDMIQNSNNWTHYSGRNQGANWSRFSSEMSGTVFMRPRLNQVQVQVFYAKRQNQRDKSIQTRSHVQFWEEFFFNANANVSGWINIDG